MNILNEFKYDNNRMDMVDHVIDSKTHQLRVATKEDITKKTPTKKYAVWKNTNKIVSDDDDEFNQKKEREQIVNITDDMHPEETINPDENGENSTDDNQTGEENTSADGVSKEELKIAIDDLKNWFKTSVQALIDKKIDKNNQSIQKNNDKNDLDYVIEVLKTTPLVQGALSRKHELDERAKRTNKILNGSSEEIKKKIYKGNIESELGEDDDAEDAGEYKNVRDLYYPETLCGISRTEPMTVSDAFNKCNTNSDSNDIACTIAYEARLRGYDMTAAMDNSKASEHLLHNLNDSWINLDTGKAPRPIFNLGVKNPDDAYRFLATTIKKGQRYVLCCGYADEVQEHIGVMNADKNSSGLVRVIDLQNRTIRVGKSDVKNYCLNEIDFAKRYSLPVSKDEDKQETAYGCFFLLRIDNCSFNPYYVTDTLVISNDFDDEMKSGMLPKFSDDEINTEEPEVPTVAKKAKPMDTKTTSGKNPETGNEEPSDDADSTENTDDKSNTSTADTSSDDTNSTDLNNEPSDDTSSDDNANSDETSNDKETSDDSSEKSDDEDSDEDDDDIDALIAKLSGDSEDEDSDEDEKSDDENSDEDEDSEEKSDDEDEEDSDEDEEDSEDEDSDEDEDDDIDALIAKLSGDSNKK